MNSTSIVPKIFMKRRRNKLLLTICGISLRITTKEISKGNRDNYPLDINPEEIIMKNNFSLEIIGMKKKDSEEYSMKRKKGQK